MARKHPVEIPPPSPSSSEEEGNPSSEEGQEEEEEDKVNNTNAGKDDEEDADETEEEEEDSDENPSSEEEQEEEEEEVEDGMEEEKVNNAIACKDDEDDDDETEEEEDEEGSDSYSDSESDLLSPSPSAFRLKPVSPPPLPTSENGKGAVRNKVKAEALKTEANGEVGGEKIEANGRVKRKMDDDADKNLWEKYPLLDASLNELESELRVGGAVLLRQNFEMIGKSLMDELEREWKKLKQDEVELFSRRNALIAKQAGLFLDRL